jgi:patatin-like phospholipase/acyl hydrolase
MVFQILAISGGGYLGLFPAYVLAEIERQIGEPIGSRFDLIAGTSIGGIIALGLGAEIKADAILEQFSARGEHIFSDRPRAKGGLAVLRDIARFAKKPKYSGVALRETVDSILGDRLLGSSAHRLLIPAVNMTKGSVQMFKTAHHPNFIRDHRLKMADIAMATSAAPTYFPLAEIGDSLFVDGGVFANAPDMCAVHEAKHFLGQDHDEIRIVSIGTTTAKFSFAHAAGTRLGGYQWLSGGRLFSTMISAQQQLVDFLLKHQFGDAYLRIDHLQSPEQQNDLGLDVATKAATQTIRGMADGAFQAISASKIFQDILAHRAPPPVFHQHPARG